MKCRFLLWLFLLLFGFNCTIAQVATCPYKTNWLTDGAIVAGGIAASVVGSNLIDKKYRLTAQDIVGLSVSDVNRFDRFAAGNYSTSAETVSDFPFYGAFLTPLLLLLDGDVK